MWVQYNVWKLLFKVISMRSNFFISRFGTPRAVCFITSCDLKASERDPILCCLNKNFCIMELRNICAVLTLAGSESGVTNFLVAKTTSLWPSCILMGLLQICQSLFMLKSKRSISPHNTSGVKQHSREESKTPPLAFNSVPNHLNKWKNLKWENINIVCFTSCALEEEK